MLRRGRGYRNHESLLLRVQKATRSGAVSGERHEH
ncbi:MAG: hypothetical protein HY613_03685 [Candidatus Rokubacteria bacterium]|nr:hypothetical protein [Candidatus Rokubacteria bacterium]